MVKLAPLHFKRVDNPERNIYDDIERTVSQEGNRVEIGNVEAKERIIKASVRLFSEKGFDKSSVSEIAEAANVTKALIYYYFKSKEDILDYLVHTLLENATSIVMDFVHASIVQMIKDGRLDIEPDRLHFINEEAIQSFLQNAGTYYERVLDYALENRAALRILMLESLKVGKHHNDLFQIMDLTKNSVQNPLFKTISEADNDFSYSDDFVLFKFFYTILPLINFAVYYDEYRALSSLSEKELRSSFLRPFQILLASLISRNSILLKNQI